MSYSWSEAPPNEIPVLTVEHWLQDVDTEPLLAEVEARIAAGKVEFVVDMSKVEFINSLVLSILLQMLTRARNKGGEVVLAHLSPKIRQILLVTRLQTAFVVCDNVRQALEYLTGEKALH